LEVYSSNSGSLHFDGMHLFDNRCAFSQAQKLFFQNSG